VAAAVAPVLDSLGPDVDLAARAAGLRVPVLVIHGREDLVANPEGAREWARRLPDARLLRLRDTGHLPFVEAAATLRRAVDFFLLGHWPPLAERVER
jgi:pimeloyl-ACP methyl ester carboxylesterase